MHALSSLIRHGLALIPGLVIGTTVAGALAGHQLGDDLAVPGAEGGQPGGEVAAEDNLVDHRRLRVVAQPLLEGVLAHLPRGVALGPLAGRRGQQGLDAEAVPPPGRRRHGVPGALLSAQAAAGADGVRGVLLAARAVCNAFASFTGSPCPLTCM